MSSSLRDYMDGNDFASEVPLLKDADSSKSHLLVEGPDDEGVFSTLISKDHCEVIVCEGKPNLISAITRLNQSQHNGYLGIQDSDFDILNGRLLPLNLVSTDGHDLEVMILSTKALDDFVDIRLRGKDRIKVDEFKSAIRARLFELGSVVGYLRFTSQRCCWGIEINTHRLLKHANSDCELSLKNAISKLKDICPEIDESEISSTEFKELSASHSHHLCRGHDMVAILGKIFSKMAKKHFRKKIKPGSDLAERLYLAFNQSHFQSTQLYQQIKNWEEDNQPYRVLVA